MTFRERLDKIVRAKVEAAREARLTAAFARCGEAMDDATTVTQRESHDPSGIMAGKIHQAFEMSRGESSGYLAWKLRQLGCDVEAADVLKRGIHG